MPKTSVVVDSLRAAQLFRLADLSLDPATANFPLRRTVAITVFTDRGGNAAHKTGVDLTKDVRRILEQYGFELTGQWGPHSGSYHITLFGTGKVEELGGSFTHRIRDMVNDVVALKKKHARANAAVTALVVVGEVVTFFWPAAAIVHAYPAIHIPMKVFEGIALANNLNEVPGVLRQLFGISSSP
jgi:hypothetical protein